LRDRLKVALDERDFAKQPLSAAELKRLFAGCDPREFLSTKSPTFRAMRLDANKLSAAAALKLMAKEPNLIKRPLTVVGRKIIAGFDRDALKSVLG
jgi:arsenate reductase-like glutaredoxin family protein